MGPRGLRARPGGGCPRRAGPVRRQPDHVRVGGAGRNRGGGQRGQRQPRAIPKPSAPGFPGRMFCHDQDLGQRGRDPPESFDGGLAGGAVNSFGNARIQPMNLLRSILRSCFKILISSTPGSAGASPYQCACGRARLLPSQFAVTVLVAFCLAARAAGAGVTLSEDSATYTLANGVLTARVNKRSGDLVSLKYQGLELMGNTSGHPAGYWEQS